MKVIVGLGNPGPKYEQTRHNVGFDVLAEIGRRLAVGRPKKRFDAELVETAHAGERVLLVCPLTFMNLSGSSVLGVRDFYQVPNHDILIICDDFALPLGRLRMRPSGSSGGQKGLEDILRRCGNDVPRLRIGIGPVPDRWDPADFVLGKFREEERSIAKTVVPRAARAALDWVELGMAACMNTYNGNPTNQQDASD
ncbi:MAG: aminoacyl-tRNA hydrolase [Planctomycetes bacterium]|nr:aminoacyl-tRNA hydrolase [Planctomycetota bacterium]